MTSLKEIIVDIFNVNSALIWDDLVFKNLESWDSLSHMNFVAAIEKTFHIELTAAEIIAMQSYQETKHILQKKGIGA